jgi:hypothetical protein
MTEQAVRELTTSLVRALRRLGDMTWPGWSQSSQPTEGVIR